MDPHEFLRDQFHGMVLQATIQRARIYSTGASESVREKFRIGLRRHLDRFVGRYKSPVCDASHVRNITALADTVSGRHRHALRGGRFRIGPAQKALNLLLKYHWAAGWIPEPPHCPFDRMIIDKLPARVRCNWTDLDDPAAYRALVISARDVAGDITLAHWEMAAYHSTSPAAQRARTV